MKQLIGFTNLDHLDRVCLLKNAVYKLKQSPHVWFWWLWNFLQSLGFKGSVVDPSLFTLHGHHIVYILVYVDDMIIIGLDDAIVWTILDALNSEFAILDLGALNYFLDIRVWHLRAASF